MPGLRVIEVAGLTKLYGDFAAVRDLSFTVRPGDVLGLVGPNGAGKTTTLRSIAGIVPPSAGRVAIAGHDLAADPIGAKRALAFFSDEPRLFDYLTVRQHLAFVARIYGVVDHEAIAQPLLDEFEIADKGDVLPGQLSRGMKQKLAIACGLLHSPQVLFFDEPLTGLDPLGKEHWGILATPGAIDPGTLPHAQIIAQIDESARAGRQYLGSDRRTPRPRLRGAVQPYPGC